jgi:hypothetical protein
LILMTPLPHRRLFVALAALTVIAPLSGLAYTLAQGPEVAPEGLGVQFNWGSVILTLFGACLGVAVMWGTLRELVKQHTEDLKDHEDRLRTVERCAIETAAASAAAVQTSAQAHSDMVVIAEGIKELLARLS